MNEVPGLLWIRRIAWLVPRSRRSSWCREWEAELTWAWRRMSGRGEPGWWGRLRLQLRAWSSLTDALWERGETMTMTGWTQDLRLALRSLIRHRAFALVSILTLGLGIGINTTVFTLVDGVLLRPLPFPESEELISLQHEGRESDDQLPISTGLYQLYRDQARTIEEIGLYTTNQVNLIVDGRPERIEVQFVTPSFFTTLGVSPEVGRAFTEEEGLPGAGNYILLSHAFWRDAWGGDPGIIGQSIEVSGNVAEVVGVMPRGFGFPEPGARLWLNLQVDPENAPLSNFSADGVARMTDGSSIEAVVGEVGGLVDRMEEFFPESGAVTFLRGVGIAPVVVPMKEAIVGDVSTTLWVLLGTVGFVLLIACANVANLLLVRAESRQREMALRSAVGAGRGDIVRWFMSESLILSAAGAIIGVGIAVAAIRLTLRFVPNDLPRMAEIGLDVRVLAFTAVLTVGSALFFGLFPLTRFGSGHLSDRLREGGARGATEGASRHLLRNGLVVTQMALALVLLIGSGLMFRSFQALRALDPGFDPEGVVTAQIAIPGSVMEEPAQVLNFYREAQERILALPGVQAVSYSAAAPLVRGWSYSTMESEDHPRGEDELPVFGAWNHVGGDPTGALGLRILEGRQLDWRDGADGNRSMMISRTMKELWWPDESPIGRRMRFAMGGEPQEWYTIVGVVENAAQNSLQETPREMVYWPLTVGHADAFQIMRNVVLAVRTTGEPVALVPGIRDIVQTLSPSTPLANVQTLEEAMDRATSRTSFTMTLLGSASGIALLLGLVGIYGVISYIVSQRTREIGVRLALGATGTSVRNMVVRQGLVLASIGMVVGLGAAWAMRSVMGALLFGVSATDPLTWGGLSGILVLTAVAASWLPAWRASRVDPAGALRAE